MSDEPAERAHGRTAEPTPSEEGSSRRRLLGAGIAVLGTGLAAAVAAPAAIFLVDPLRNSPTSGGKDFVAVGDREVFKGGAPVKVDLFVDRVDAWNRAVNVKIGSAWVLERDGALVAFSSVCPHLGCAIDYDPAVEKFKCPCHRSAFALDGAREEGPSPRGLDELQIKDEDGVVSVMWQRYRQGVAAQEPIG
jgi:menaquinol-cytochrome c reductase iron-sulfur subunit